MRRITTTQLIAFLLIALVVAGCGFANKEKKAAEDAQKDSALIRCSVSQVRSV